MLTAYTDGGARGNPGPAGYGVQIVDDEGTVVAELYEPLGHATNNVAEYRGLLAALEWAIAHKAAPLRVRMDSELIVKQMLGVYKVKHAGLQPLHAQARALVTKIGRVVFEHVRREQNREADRLSNIAMDIASGKPAPELAAPARSRTSARPDAAEPRAPRTIAIPRPARPSAPAVHHARPSSFDFGDS
jgi:probable phosphoglycerate mutase